MSGWTILTVRGKEAKDYDLTECDYRDRWDATCDIAAKMDTDDRILKWTTWSSHVYAYLQCARYDFEFAEELLEEYGHMVDDAVVLGANDTSDSGMARYYDNPELGQWSDQFEETEYGNVGELALCVINARHSIVARDPFHNRSGLLDDRYLEKGKERLNTERRALHD